MQLLVGIRHARKGIHWASLDKLCKPNNVRGIGFRKINDFNLALLGKQAWNLSNNEESLVAKVFKARYFPKCSLLDAGLCWNNRIVA